MSGKFALESYGVWATNLHVFEGGMVHSKWLRLVVVELFWWWLLSVVGCLSSLLK